jgi:hypothetical protein
MKLVNPAAVTATARINAETFANNLGDRISLQLTHNF